jgi:hypothetical protein
MNARHPRPLLRQRLERKHYELLVTQTKLRAMAVEIEDLRFALEKAQTMRAEAEAKTELIRTHLQASGYLIKGADILPIGKRQPDTNEREHYVGPTETLTR